MKDFENKVERTVPWVIFVALCVLVVTAAYDVYSNKGSLTFARLAPYVAILALLVAGGAWALLVVRRKATTEREATAAQLATAVQDAARTTVAQQATAVQDATQTTAAQQATQEPLAGHPTVGPAPTETKRRITVSISLVVMPWVVLLLLVIFVGTSIAGIAGIVGNASAPTRPALDAPQLLPFATLTFLALAFGIWFIICFTGNIEDTPEDRERRRRQSFRFAYVFTLTTLVVMIFPVTNPWQPDLLGPVSLIRGCVDPQRDNTVPMSIRCGNDDLVAAKVEDVKRDSAASAATGAASVTTPGSATPGASTTDPASGAQEASAAATAKKAATDAAAAAKVASETAAAAKAASEAMGTASGAAAAASAASAAGGAGFSRRYAKQKGFIYEPSYPWLVVIGGTYSTSADVFPKPDKAATPASGASATQADDVVPDSRKPYQVVEGGFVLPYYVVLLAMLGGAIALTRKIPEYQKRSEPDYEPTQEQPRLDDRTVREQVVFQIMQLITAPFIAMVAFYSFAPSTVATGIALGFISGFSSELVLLQIRSVVEGLHPKSAPNVADTTARTGIVKGTVHRGDDPKNPTPVPNATVTVQGVDPKMTTQTDTSGGFAITKVPIGPHVITASEGEGTSIASGTQTATVSAATETMIHVVIKKA